jgi:hypothetical protein
MRLDVYTGDTLAATFAYGRAPAYHGAVGQQLKALVEEPHFSFNPWTGRLAPAPPDDSPAWWAADILAAVLFLEGARVVATGLPALARRVFWEVAPDPEDPA